MNTSSTDGTDCELHHGVAQGHERPIGLIPEMSACFANTFNHVFKMVRAMTKHFSQALSLGSIWAAAINKGASCPAVWVKPLV